MSTLFSFFSNHKKAIIIIAAIAIFSPLWINWIMGISYYFYFDWTYPEWDRFCRHHVDLEKFDESALDIAINAIKEKYPDVNIPDNAVTIEHTEMSIMELVPENQKWSVIVDALNENGIDAEYVTESCA